MQPDLVFDTFTQEEFEALPMDARLELIKAAKRFRDDQRRADAEHQQKLLAICMDWTHALQDATETLRQLVKE